MCKGKFGDRGHRQRAGLKRREGPVLGWFRIEKSLLCNSSQNGKNKNISLLLLKKKPKPTNKTNQTPNHDAFDKTRRQVLLK